MNPVRHEDYLEIIKKYFSKDYSHKMIVKMIRKKYNVIISLRNLSRILSKHSLKRKNIVESSYEELLMAIQLELQGSGRLLGYRSMWQRLRKKYNLKVKQKTVMVALKLIDPEGVEARSRYRLKRRQYLVPGPNYVWHADNHDKLKRFGFPIYGIIDGFSKKVLTIRVSRTNNNPEVIAHYFHDLVKKFNFLPSLLRTDKGNEAIYMGEIQMMLR